MSIEVKKISLEAWKEIAKEAHYVVFNELRESDENTFDFAIVVEKEGIPQCYSTCIELDKYSLYMQHGGGFPSARGSVGTFNGYKKMIEWIHDRYPRILTKIKNTNTPMLKFALQVGFVINGIDAFGSEVYVRLLNDREDINVIC